MQDQILHHVSENKKAVLSQRGSRDAAVNFNMYRILRIEFSATAQLFYSLFLYI